MEVLQKTYTYADLLSEFPAETRCEIIKNELFMPPAPNPEHQDISRDLGFYLLLFVRQNNLGKIYYAPFDVILDINNVVQPDIIFIDSENLKNLTKRGLEGVPDLVVEIISPSTFYRDSVEKKDLYEKFGVQEYWIVEPANRVIEIFTLQNGKYVLHQFAVEQGKVQSKLLQGFEVDLQMIFPNQS
ncbi:MAG: Uma2 family endonuclease [Raineya sp.]|nr:Uma2 family endonuclease [Raineya sp.]